MVWKLRFLGRGKSKFNRNDTKEKSIKYLNLGLGDYFSKDKEWVNLYFEAAHKGVIAYNLLKGIPSEYANFDLVYL